MSAPEIKEIREAFADYRSDWQEIFEQADMDMQALSVEGPWSSVDRKSRQDAGRPCIHFDQVNQFINQAIGNVRKNKRAIKIMPRGDGADEKLAKRRAALVMAIEERSQAQPIYLQAFEGMAQRSLAFTVIRTEFCDCEGFDQEILIKPIANPKTVLFSPNYKQPDASDVSEVFLVDRIPKAEFKRKYPKAKITEFSNEMLSSEEHVSDWISEKTVQIAEDWRLEYDYFKLLLVDLQGGPRIFTETEWELAKEKMKGTVKQTRTAQKARVIQYLTNGLEILDEIEWAGSRIPVVGCFGPERWIDNGGKAERQLLSMVRFARDPQMMFDYLVSGEAEVAKKIPKVPFIGAKGQFESDRDAWEQSTDVPHAFLQYDAMVDGVPPGSLPPPQFTQYAANFQEWEIGKDAAGRSIQAAMGITPLPTAMQRRNEKSGIALERIDDMEALGTYQFVDRYESCYLHNLGWQINELITKIYDTPRQMPISEPDGSRDVIQVIGNTSHPIQKGQYDTAGLDEGHFHTGLGQFDVTISTGPSYQSEREAQADFVDELISNMANLPMPGTPGAKALALGIRMRPELGPIGEQLAEVFDPPDPENLPPEARAIVSQLQGQLQALQQENQALHMDRAGRVLEQQTKKEIESMKQSNENLRTKLEADIKVLIAEIQTKAQQESERLQMYKEVWSEVHGGAHDVALGAQEHAQAKDLASHTVAIQPPEPQVQQ